ncbi:MAG: BolA family protein [Porticoccaceae bacterium]
MNVQETIIGKLRQALSPAHLEVVNESHMHSVPPNSETHFKLVIVADGFEGKRQVQRHQLVYGLLKDELGGGVHALALHTYSPRSGRQQAWRPIRPNVWAAVNKHNPIFYQPEAMMVAGQQQPKDS